MREEAEEHTEGIEPGYMSTVCEAPEDSAAKYRVHEDMAADIVPIEDITQWSINPNNGDIDRIARSLQDHGQFRAIGVNRGNFAPIYANTIAYGNHTYQAALSLGWTHIAVTWIDVEEVEFDEIAMVDNQASSWSWMDQGMALAVYNKDGVDPERAGTTQEEMQLMAQRTSGDADAEPPEAFESLDNTTAQHECPSCGYSWG